MFSKPVKTAYLSMTLTAALFIIGGVIFSTTVIGSGLWDDRAKQAAVPIQPPPFRQLARVFAHVDGVRPEIIRVRPGRLLLQVENETQGDVSLAIERLNTGAPNTRLGKVQTSDNGKRAQLEFGLGAGEYIFYDESRPEFTGKLIVQPIDN
jgi:hypothetical protein